ncbi:HTH-type transcriptional regulator/antitoxin HipB [Paraburkholderia sp. GAS333]|uniref:helix-turn-helix domain-containing protein n=1 Tax=Paraburkholderia sp. GAS333 TaxID=3156279 RepID=UPI003D236E18
MDYPIKTLGQLRPILQGFRKAAGLTQAGMASHLGVTQQTYAQLEANPAAVSVDRLFRVLRVLQVDLTLIPRAAGSPESDVVAEDTIQSTSIAQAPRKTAATRSTKKEPTATARNAKGKAQASRDEETPRATSARAKNTKAKPAPRSTAKPKSVGKKREDW